mmetsp:Transcript_29078/g.28049  ORF Transcript_29078/g.28049 Transcript_29078/m.28049 type:complete len:118 (-) Transcript_29078:270-623(-)
MNGKPKELAYAFDPNDEVDRMLAMFLNQLGISVPIKRLGGGYYMFGTKKIFCKIINGKLVVRVGGGYMGIEEFIMQYGQQEAEKCRLLAEAEANGTEGKLSKQLTKVAGKGLTKQMT